MQGGQSDLGAIAKWPAKKAIEMHREISVFSGGDQIYWPGLTIL